MSTAVGPAPTKARTRLGGYWARSVSTVRAYLALTGTAAIDRYVEENRGRRVELVAELIGESATGVTGSSNLMSPHRPST